jgi:hypothetical protein
MTLESSVNFRELVVGVQYLQTHSGKVGRGEVGCGMEVDGLLKF